MDLEVLYSCFLRSSGINTDTRSIQPGQMFWALKGPSFNGNRFAPLALESGASFVVTDEETGITDKRVLKVENGLETLQKLAHHHRLVWGKEVLAVCGSNGKTTTKELITRALGVEKNVFATPGNLNNHLGVPLSLLRIQPGHEMAIIEMGANHPGEIADLCRIAEPDSGLITNIGKDHLEGFGSIDGSAEANAELFDFLRKRNGTAFINTQDEWNRKLQTRVNSIHTYPAPLDQSPCENLHSDFYLKIKIPESEAVETQLVGQYNFNNLACSLAVARHYQINMQKAVAAVTTYSPANNRSQVLHTERNVVISDAYNANPSSVLAALENLCSLKAEFKVAILGDMLELGTDSESEHAELGRWAAQKTGIQFFVTGTEMEAFSRAFQGANYFSNKTDLEVFLKENPPSGSTILLKGSRGMKLETLIPLL